MPLWIDYDNIKGHMSRICKKRVLPEHEIAYCQSVAISNLSRGVAWHTAVACTGPNISTAPSIQHTSHYICKNYE